MIRNFGNHLTNLKPLRLLVMKRSLVNNFGSLNYYYIAVKDYVSGVPPK